MAEKKTEKKKKPSFLESLSKKVNIDLTKPSVDQVGLKIKVPIAPPLGWLIGGIPLSSVITVFGPESSGKSTLCGVIAKSFQDAGGVVVWIDQENSFDTAYMQNIGLNTEDVIYSKGLTIEQVFELMEAVAKDSLEHPDINYLVVWDSIASTPSEEEAKRTFNESTVASVARAMSSGFRKLSLSLAYSPRVAFLMISQVREKIGSPIGGYQMYGGRALKHFEVLSLELKPVSYIKEENNSGVVSFVNIVKSKVEDAPLFSGMKVVFSYGKGIDYKETLFNLAVDLGIFKNKRGWFEYQGKNYRKNDLKEVVINEEMLKYIEGEWKSRYKSR